MDEFAALLGLGAGLMSFFGIFLLAFTILPIILFFKVWKMTNDVDKILKELQKQPPVYPPHSYNYSNPVPPAQPTEAPSPSPAHTESDHTRYAPRT